MRTAAIAAFLLLLTLACIQPTPAQWEWAGGVPASNFETVGAAGNWIIASGRYSGDWPVSSTDGGESWSSHGGLGAIAFNPVLVKSATDTFALAIGNQNHIYRLRDTAATYIGSESGTGGAPIRWLAFARGAGPNAPGAVVAASPSAGIFLSTDLGMHWSPSDSGLTSLNTITVAAVDSVFLAGTTDRGVFRSTDYGRTWSAANAGLPDTSISVIAASSGWAFAASGTRVYQSSNGGASWSLIPKSLPAAAQNLVLVPTLGKGIGVAVFAVTSVGCCRLSFNDADWVVVRGPAYLVMGLPFTVAAVDTVLYAVDYDQMNRSSDLGATWFRVGQGIGGEISTGHASLRSGHPRLYSGPFVSTNFGSNWISLHQAYDDGSQVAVISVSPDTSALGFDQLTIGTDSGAVEFSDNGGRTWKVVHDRQWNARGHGCLDVTELDGVVFATLQSNKNWRYAGDTVSGIYRTTIDGDTWKKIGSPGLSDSLILTLDLFRAKDGGRVLFAGTWYSLFRSTNDGESWTLVTSVRGGTKRFKEVNGMLYLCTAGSLRVTYDENGDVHQTLDTAGVYRSSDQGLTWTEVTGDLHPATGISGFAAAGSAEDSRRVFLAMRITGTGGMPSPFGAVMTSTEGGWQWRPFTGNLPPSYSFAPMGADDRYVYCMARRRPWSEAELTSAGTQQASHPATLSLSQNYPNPFNPATTISFQVPALCDVRLAVYDLLGREVATVVNERKAPGSYQVSFDGSPLASGMYVYRLTAGSNVQSRKMLLLK